MPRLLNRCVRSRLHVCACAEGDYVMIVIQEANNT